MDKFLTKTKLSASAAASTSEIDEALLVRHYRRKRKAASMELGERSCTTCFKSKSCEDFSKGQSMCKPCNVDRARKYQIDQKKMSPLEKIQKQEAKILKQKEMSSHACSDHDIYINKCLKCKKNYTLANSKRQRKKPVTKAIEKSNKLEKNYNGLDLLGYKKLCDEQELKCAICLCISDKLVVDHHHVTLKVRALLCQQCNKGIGLFREKVEVLNEAIEYLK